MISISKIRWLINVLDFRRQSRLDRRCIPRSGERVPYLIIFGEPGRPLIQSVRTPDEVLMDSSLRPNSQYYITKVIIPPLSRCLSLVGADIMSWYTELPKTYRPRLVAPSAAKPGEKSKFQPQGVILQYFASEHCAVCDVLTQKPICDRCSNNPQHSVLSLSVKIHKYVKLFKGFF